jgi:hypothetical protein
VRSREQCENGASIGHVRGNSWQAYNFSDFDTVRSSAAPSPSGNFEFARKLEGLALTSSRSMHELIFMRLRPFFRATGPQLNQSDVLDENGGHLGV